MTWPCLSIILFYFQLAVCPTVCPTMKVQLVQLIIICEIWCSSPFSEITYSVSISPPDGSRAQLFEIWPFWTRISPSLSYFFCRLFAVISQEWRRELQKNWRPNRWTDVFCRWQNPADSSKTLFTGRQNAVSVQAPPTCHRHVKTFSLEHPV